MTKNEYYKKLIALRSTNKYKKWNEEQTEMIRRIIVDTGATSNKDQFDDTPEDLENLK
jgi:hypothetical protein